MFVLSNFLVALAQVLDYILWAYVWILIARVVISWVNADPYNPLVRFVYNVTEPVLVSPSARGCRPSPVASIFRRSWFGSRWFFCNTFS